jgi:DegV family protein with EDD domain
MVEPIISIEATSDLPKNTLQEYDLHVIDMDFLIDGVVYNTATDSVTSTELYARMKKGAKTSTSQINSELYEDFFTNLLNEGKDIIHIAFSSGLSGTSITAKEVAEELNKTHNNKIYVIDSLCACSGQGLLAILTRMYCDKANSIEEVVKYIEETKMNLAHVFTVDNLKYLANGGRVKSSTAFIGNLLSIKPVMHVDNVGHLVPFGKVISRKKSLQSIVDKLVSTYNKDSALCYISHADCISDANCLYDMIIEKTNLKPVITDLGPVIGSHSGPGTIAVFYLAKER